MRTNRQWLIDCGPTVPRALWQRGGESTISTHLFHPRSPDHCTGLTALLNYWKSYSRQKPVIIYCQPAQRPVLMQLAALANWPQADLGFTIDWRDMPRNWTWQDWHIRTAPPSMS
jgi:ribonuclease BN (tRNA processing enzyme)